MPIVGAVIALAAGRGRAAPVVYDAQFQIELYATLPAGVTGLAFNAGGRFNRGVYATCDGGSVVAVQAKNTFSVLATGLPFDDFEPAFDPSGEFGNDLYIMASERSSGPPDRILRVNPAGNVNLFYAGQQSDGLDGLAPGMAFGPAGSGFGTALYTVDYEHNTLARFDPSATRSSLGDFPLSNHNSKDLEFSRGGSWGVHGFVLDAADHEVIRVDAGGAATTFWSFEDTDYTHSIAFGDGGAFGEDLYAGAFWPDSLGHVLRVNSAGIATPFVAGLDNEIRATEFGDGQLFVGTTSGEIYRIFPIPEPIGLTAFAFSGLLMAWRRSCRLR
jgi:hypothetical protein